MEPTRSVLLFGHDESLTHTRAQILRQAGFLVSVATSYADAEYLLKTTNPDLFVLCHTATQPEAHELLIVAQTVSSIRILVLIATGPYDLGMWASDVHWTLDGPTCFISKVRQITEREGASARTQPGRRAVTVVTALCCGKRDTLARSAKP